MITLTRVSLTTIGFGISLVLGGCAGEVGDWEAELLAEEASAEMTDDMAAVDGEELGTVSQDVIIAPVGLGFGGAAIGAARFGAVSGFSATAIGTGFGAGFVGAPLFGAGFVGAPLAGAGFVGAPLAGAGFIGAPLFGAGFLGAPAFGAAAIAPGFIGGCVGLC